MPLGRKRSRSESLSSDDNSDDSDTAAFLEKHLLPIPEEVERLAEVLEGVNSTEESECHCEQLTSFSNFEEVPALDRAVELHCQHYYAATSQPSDSQGKKHKKNQEKKSAELLSQFTKEITASVIAAAVELATRMREEPKEWLKRMNAPRQVWSTRELYGLVACAFCCVFDEREDIYLLRDSFTTINYSEMITASADSSVEVVKLRLLLDYFRWHASHDEGDDDEDEEDADGESSSGMEVLRGSLACRLDTLVRTRADASLPPLVIHGLGESIEDQHDMLRMDFANRWVGGGALSDGSVQEEIIFCQCPELNTLRWGHTALGDGESLVVRGYRYYGRIVRGTYGSGIAYEGPVVPPFTPDGALLVVDALDYRDADPRTQYGSTAIEREVSKLVGALTQPAVSNVRQVAGGNWGCGVFGGDYELKLLIQWLACALCGKELHYFPFDLKAVAEFGKLAAKMEEVGMTVGQLHYFMIQCGSGRDDATIWTLLEEYVGSLTEEKQ